MEQDGACTAATDGAWCGTVPVVTRWTQELHQLEMARDGAKLQAGTDQAAMVAKAARSVGLEVPDRNRKP